MSLWSQNSLFIVAGLVIAAQGAAIITLLLERQRRARADATVRDRADRFRLIAEHAPVMIWTARPDTTLDYLNETCVEFSGLPLKELLGEGWLTLVHPDDLDQCQQTYGRAFEARVPLVMEYRLLRSDGVYRWVLDSGMPRHAADGTYLGYIGCSVDITERKNAEDEISEGRAALEQSAVEIRHLAGRLIEAQEAERARIARDLHDDVSQQIAGLAIAMSALRRRVSAPMTDPATLTADVDGLHQRTVVLGENVRHLSHDLHPGLLQHVGLDAALQAYCVELQRHHTFALRCEVDGAFEALDPDTALCLYRAAQEALSNVVKHAHATRADVRLVRHDDSVELTVADDGRGFDIAGSRSRPLGLGLVSIRERARLAGGTLIVVTEQSRGTRVRVQIPAAAPGRSAS